jgi:hypothetical protein
MKTEDLIDALANEPAPPKAAAPLARVAVALVAGLMGGGALLAVSLGVRPDIGVALATVMLKAGFAGAATAVVAPLLLRLARAGRAGGWRLAAIGGFAALCVLVVAVTLLGAEPGKRFALWMGGAFPWCVAIIPALAAPTALLLVRVLRDLAPTDLSATGATVGAVAGGIGAMVYAMYCPVDSAAFVITWYAVGIAVAAALGALLGPRLLRW